MSVVVTVLYPNSPGSKFDLGYYTKTHIPLVRQNWDSHGLGTLSIMSGKSSADGSGAAEYQMIANLDFPSLDHWKAAVAAGGATVMGDLANFTDVQPVIQINEPLNY